MTQQRELTNGEGRGGRSERREVYRLFCSHREDLPLLGSRDLSEEIKFYLDAPGILTGRLIPRAGKEAVLRNDWLSPELRIFVLHGRYIITG